MKQFLEYSTRLVPKSPLGWHLRPAGMLAGVAYMFHSEIEAKFGKRIANAKSLMGLITLEAGRGARLYVTARGCDAKQAIQAIKSKFSCGEKALQYASALRQP
jgi:phosphotransferase system HPr (HPr) family protein